MVSSPENMVAFMNYPAYNLKAMPAWLAMKPVSDLYLGFHYCTATKRWLVVTWSRQEEKGHGLELPKTWRLA